MNFVPTRPRLFTLLLLLLFGFSPNSQADFAVNVLDVGYGSAIDLEIGFSHVWFDVGPEDSKKEILDYFAKAGATSADLVFLTHTHPDHIGGLTALASRYRIGKIFWNEELPPNETVVEWIDQVEKVSEFHPLRPETKLLLSKRISLETLPNSLTRPSLNDGSLVFLVKEKNKKVLITGDIQDERQNSLAENSSKKLRKPDLFIWPHHGDTLTEAFASAIGKAGICVISVGENKYGLPKEDALSQAETLCDEIYRTDELGTLRFVVTRKGVYLNGMKSSK